MGSGFWHEWCVWDVLQESFDRSSRQIYACTASALGEINNEESENCCRPQICSSKVRRLAGRVVVLPRKIGIVIPVAFERDEAHEVLLFFDQWRWPTPLLYQPSRGVLHRETKLFVHPGKFLALLKYFFSRRSSGSSEIHLDRQRKRKLGEFKKRWRVSSGRRSGY